MSSPYPDEPRADGNQTSTAVVPRDAFAWYLASSSLWLVAMSLQGFLVAWLLADTLGIPAGQFGLTRALIEIPPVVMLLVGGLFGDRVDGRRLLTALTIAVAAPPLAMAAISGGDGETLTYWPVVAFAMALAIVQSLSDPARQAMINRVTRTDIQRSVTLVTVVTSLVGIAGFWLGGRLDDLGLRQIFVLQALIFAVSIVAVRRLPPLPVRRDDPLAAAQLLEGFKGLWALPLIRNVIGLNFLSSLFNAGAYVVAIPYIVTRVYEGDAAFFSSTLIAFTIGSIGSNVALYFLMPLLHPGRLFLAMQLTRMAILAALWFEPPVWLFFTLILFWGINMGVTSTVMRTTVQELAPERIRAQIMALLLFSFMLSAPISSVVLGALVEATDPMTALLPGIPISLVIFIVGITASGLWQYRSPSHGQATV